MRFSIAKQFTDTPGPRYRKQGDFSGEEFREEFLWPMYERYEKTGECNIIDLDGVFGYPTSFLEEAFGGLARVLSPERVKEAFTFESLEQPGIIEEIYSDINNAKKRWGIVR